ncbi:MAG: hypothetical protein ACFHWX_08305 [Bacteroidota bacterium]
MRDCLAGIIISVFSIILLSSQGCNGIETDISKKLEYPFLIIPSGSNVVSIDSIINIPAHDEIDDYVDYAVYPNPFKVNEVGYKIREVGLENLSQVVDIQGFYRNASLDTIPLFQIFDLQVVSSTKTVLPVSSIDLMEITNLVNNQIPFNMIIDISGDSQAIDFILEIYFDTTITIDYDL